MAGPRQLPQVTLVANLLLAADGRFPAGGYAHSSGLEQAVERGRVNDETSLRAGLIGSLQTTGRSSACFAAAACADWQGERSRLELLAREESARIPSAALRDASRAQGRQFLRAAAATWPDAEIPRASLVPGGAHLSMAQGIVMGALGSGPDAAATLALYSLLTGQAAAAVKLLGLDPFEVNRCVADLMAMFGDIVEEASDLATCAPAELPAPTAPLLEIGAQLHAVRQPRMFAS